MLSLIIELIIHDIGKTQGYSSQHLPNQHDYKRLHGWCYFLHHLHEMRMWIVSLPTRVTFMVYFQICQLDRILFFCCVATWSSWRSRNGSLHDIWTSQPFGLVHIVLSAREETDGTKEYCKWTVWFRGGQNEWEQLWYYCCPLKCVPLFIVICVM